MQHIEFFDIDHFENYYHRVKPAKEIIDFIDFFWETKFDDLLQQNPEGFSDALFPNIGYTYLINLGTPFMMQVDEKRFEMKSDGFLPRNKSIECFHRQGNRLFGIKFKVSPVIFEKKVNFSAYSTGVKNFFDIKHSTKNFIRNAVSQSLKKEQVTTIALLISQI